MNTKRKKINMRVILRKATSIMLTLALCLCGMPLMEGVEEVHGAVIKSAMMMDFYVGRTLIGTVTVDIDDTDGRSVTVNGNPPIDGLPHLEFSVPPGSSGDIMVEILGDGNPDIANKQVKFNSEPVPPWLAYYSGIEVNVEVTYDYTKAGSTAIPQTCMFVLLLTEATSPPSGGSGGGAPPEKEEPVKVINQENRPNESSDNILTPLNTEESGGTSSTVVTTREVRALLDLAEQHKNDVPEGERQIIIKIEDSEGVENTNYEVFIPGGELLKMAEGPVDVLAIQTSAGDFRVRAEDFRVLGQSNVTIKLGKLDNNGRPGVDASLVSGQKIITGFEDAALGIYSVEIRIPYVPAPGEDISALVIEYIREDGTTEIVTEAIYDEVNKCLRFFPTHLSKYGVSYNPKLFKDVKSTHWASGSITFLAARNVINGREDGTFRPDDKVSKAEFVTMMTKAFSAASLGKKTVKSYKDVPLDAWYAKAVGWSYLNNISNAIAKNGNFYPNEPLSREDMATLSNNISLGLNLKLKEKKPAITFKDGKTIAAYAVPGVDRMSKCGIVSGNTSGNFMPKASLTRAQAASIISTLMAGMK